MTKVNPFCRSTDANSCSCGEVGQFKDEVESVC